MPNAASEVASLFLKLLFARLHISVCVCVCVCECKLL